MSSPSEGECWIQDSDHMDEYRGRVMDCDVNVLTLANKGEPNMIHLDVHFFFPNSLNPV